MRHSLQQEKSKTKQTQKHEQTTQKQTTQTTTNNNTTIHVFLFYVLLCLLCSLLTHKGACGIVGNENKAKQSRHRNNEQTTQKKHTAQISTNINANIHVLCCVCCSVCYACYQPIKEHAA